MAKCVGYKIVYQLELTEEEIRVLTDLFQDMKIPKTDDRNILLDLKFMLENIRPAKV